MPRNPVRQAMAQVPDDACPASLRLVLDRWKAGAATDAELIEASFYAQLDFLSEYRPRPYPTPPEPVRAFRALSAEERRSWSAAEQATLYRQHSAFFEQDARVKTRNQDSARTLRDLLAWATEQSLPGTMLQAIQSALLQHQDVPVEDAEPVTV